MLVWTPRTREPARSVHSALTGEGGVLCFRKGAGAQGGSPPPNSCCRVDPGRPPPTPLLAPVGFCSSRLLPGGSTPGPGLQPHPFAGPHTGFPPGSDLSCGPSPLAGWPLLRRGRSRPPPPPSWFHLPLIFCGGSQRVLPGGPPDSPPPPPLLLPPNSEALCLPLSPLLPSLLLPTQTPLPTCSRPCPLCHQKRLCEEVVPRAWPVPLQPQGSPGSLPPALRPDLGHSQLLLPVTSARGTFPAGQICAWLAASLLSGLCISALLREACVIHAPPPPLFTKCYLFSCPRGPHHDLNDPVWFFCLVFPFLLPQVHLLREPRPSCLLLDALTWGRAWGGLDGPPALPWSDPFPPLLFYVVLIYLFLFPFLSTWSLGFFSILSVIIQC